MSVDKNMKILIVDDYKTMLRIIRNLLKQIGFENVEEATDGQHGLEKLEQDDYGMILSDWNMEPLNGLDFLREVRATERLKDIPFILITGENRANNVILAKEAGVSGYIVKPFNSQTLKSKIVSVLGEF